MRSRKPMIVPYRFCREEIEATGQNRTAKNTTNVAYVHTLQG